MRSVERALKYLGLECTITDSARVIRRAERVIFPGVGAAGRAMEVVTSSGLGEVIHEVVDRGTPFLGICLGTQIIFDKSEEDDVPCLGIIPGTVRRFPDTGNKIPHMGWNTIAKRTGHPLFAGIDDHAQFYFVHSFYPHPSNGADTAATTSYGIEFASVIARENVVATQFHPEKSGRFGLRMLENFSRWDGRM